MLAWWLNRHALANFCPNELSELHTVARNEVSCFADIHFVAIRRKRVRADREPRNS